ncbi:MAG: 30S ribosomal protein S15 [Treponema sp.]|nr:30S ribosomal protein S15 [Treponema sp.]MBR5964769.1 30S ribosomal protein S15 [Treponema sp.]
MALSKELSHSIVSKFGANENDTGNTKVQIALLTKRIEQLTDHVNRFPKDSSAKRSMMKVVGQRKRFLKYLMRKDLEAYRALIKELGLRK